MIACYIAMHAGASCSGFHDEVTTLDISRIKTIFLGALFSEVQARAITHVINNINMTVQFIYMNVAARILGNTAETFTRTSTCEVVNTTTFCFTINFEGFQAAHAIMAPHATIKGHIDFAALIL